MARHDVALIEPEWLLPDDDEESVVGADWHQDAIRTLVYGLRDVAEVDGLPWHVGDQLPLVGPRPDGTLWRPEPDTSVHPTAGPHKRAEIDLRTEGLPALLIEVLSKSTWQLDLALEPREGRPRAKAWGYLALWGVPEYLTFDPLGEFVPEQVRAWKREGGRIVTWEPGPSGRYESALGVSFAIEGSLLRVYDRRGELMRSYSERRVLLAEQERQLRIERQHAEAERQRAADEQAERRVLQQQVAEMEAELRRLRGDQA
jgi:Uma2 family endonuclease